MPLGQAGPPASTKQVQYLQALLQKAGYDGFRDARRPLGLTQRQGSGKFTKSEASALIDRLLNGDAGESDDPSGSSSITPVPGQLSLTGEQVSATDRLEAERLEMVRGLPADLLAAELERRGWSVTPPD